MLVVLQHNVILLLEGSGRFSDRLEWAPQLLRRSQLSVLHDNFDFGRLRTDHLRQLLAFLCELVPDG